MEMFCRQCEQTSQGTGCTKAGVCGKPPEAAILMDVLVRLLQGLAFYGGRARELGIRDAKADRTMMECLFATITNVDFAPERLTAHIRQAHAARERLKKLLSAHQEKIGAPPPAALFVPAAAIAGLLAQGSSLGLRANDFPEDIRSLREILLYGLKGMAAYAHHAALLGAEDESVNAFFHTGMNALNDPSLSADRLIGLIMAFGKVNVTCLKVLDGAHTGMFGHPEPTGVTPGVRKGPAIIVSGHDLLDLENLLKQTAGKGINVYTHGEMLPAHAYPALKKYPHLAGHFGTAWQNQQKEFDNIPAVVLMTTNCIQKPRESYKNNLFTTGLVAWPGVTHIAGEGADKDFSPLIKKALETGGFPADEAEKEILVGFGHHAVLGVADKVIAAVKSGAIRHFFLIGGCDGAKPGRNYYTEFAKRVPDDCVILTLACGKFRFNREEFGDIGGIPRLLDCGQCNDAYSAVVIAQALADAFHGTINDLPLSFILSWYEQKAVCILLSLFALGVKNIRLGPTLPAFVSPGVLQVLVEKFGVRPIITPEQDLNDILT